MKGLKTLFLGLFLVGTYSFAEESISELPVTLEKKVEGVYGTFGINVGIIPTFNAAVGYQGTRLGVDLQSNLFLIFPLDVSSHLKLGHQLKKGNLYGGIGPFYSVLMGFGGELLAGYRSTPEKGVGFFVEGFGRPVYQNKSIGEDDDVSAAAAATIIGAGVAGLRAGVAF